MKMIISFCLYLIGFFFQSAWAQEVPAETVFVKMKTPHFEIIFDSRHRPLADLYAYKLEKAYDFLASILAARPEKTVVIINDKTDATNGYATILPYPHIMIYPVLPSIGDSLSESGDWTLELLAHEYTHILTFEPIGENIRFLRSIFGSIISPNLLLPTWFKEGIAVHVETAIGQKGRLRSIYQDSILRAYSLSDQLMTIDIAAINDPLPLWPEGMRPYLFGSVLWSQMMKDTDGKAMPHLFQRHSERLPYLINAPAEEILGFNYEGEFLKTLKVTEELAKKQIQALEKTPPTPFQRFPVEGTIYTNKPSVSDDGQEMALIAVNDGKRRSIQFFKKQNGKFVSEDVFINGKTDTDGSSKPFDGPPVGSIQKVSWFHKRRAVVYDRMDFINRIQKFSDLYIYDLETKKIQTLSKGLRGREPSVAPDDSHIVFVKLEAGKTSLAIYDLNTESSEILFTAPLMERISGPIFLDSKNIVYSQRDEDGNEGLFIFNTEKQERRPLLPQIKQAIHPFLTSEGLAFLSGQTGVYNIYLANNELTSAMPVSHSLTTLLNATFDFQTKDYYVTGMTEKGPQIQILLAHDRIAVEGDSKELPSILPLFEERYPIPKSKLTNGESASQSLPANAEVSEYSRASNIWPRYWIPFIATSTQTNGLLISAQSSAFDPLKKHMYNFMLNYNTYNGYVDYAFDYTNSVSKLPWSFLANRLGTFDNLGNTISTEATYSLAAQPDLFWVSPYFSCSPGWTYTELTLSSKSNKSSGPSVGMLFQNYSRAGMQISPESGYGYYLGHTEYLKQSDYVAFSRTRASGIYYFNKWLPEHHVIMTKFSTTQIPKWQSVGVLYGAANTAMFMNSDLATPTFVMRGFSLSQFIGLRTYSLNLEYRLPLYKSFRGSGTAPYFFHQIYGSVICDVGAVDGIIYNNETKLFDYIQANKLYSSQGVEFKMDMTLGYVLPLTWVMGLYLPRGMGAPQGSQVGMALQIGALN